MRESTFFFFCSDATLNLPTPAVRCDQDGPHYAIHESSAARSRTPAGCKMAAPAEESGPAKPAIDAAPTPTSTRTATQQFIYENRNTVAALVASFCSTIAGFPLDSVKYVVASLAPITFSGRNDGVYVRSVVR